ncbi:hypothetical protein ETB97_010373 [Aspergillus alliaceus]|uniref:Uncharacterized protein n=1 Tax=Petromyces alliaceus TaxID=209559 RepID=A0A8H6E8E9_PETAA|nr:hypothetical protein ETB97_010373 [Aspergillus burnettii]
MPSESVFEMRSQECLVIGSSIIACCTAIQDLCSAWAYSAGRAYGTQGVLAVDEDVPELGTLFGFRLVFACSFPVILAGLGGI